MAIVKGPDKSITLNEQRDYLTLRTPNGNFTTSWGGAKSSGKLATHPTAFRAMDRFVQTEGKKTSIGESMRLLLDPKVLSKFWPEWNETVKPNTFVVGDVVSFDPSSMFAKKHKGGVVVKVARKSVFIRQPDNTLCGFDYQILVKNPK